MSATKPLGVLEIVNAATTVLRRNLLALLTFTLLAYLPRVPLSVVTTHLSQIAVSEKGPLGFFTISWLSFAVMWVVELIWSSVLLVALYRYLSDEVGGRSPDILGTIGSTFERFLPVVFTKILIGLIAVGVLVAGLFFIGIFFVLWLSIGWALVNPVMAVEGCYYFAALRRSWKLMFGPRTEPEESPTFVRYVLLYLIFILIALVLGFVAVLSQWALSVLGTASQGGISRLSNPPLAVTLTNAVIQTIIESVVTGFCACAIFIFYTDVKARTEPSPATEPSEPIPPPSLNPSPPEC